MYPEEDEEVRTYSEVVSELEALLEEFMDREAERFASVVSLFKPPEKVRVRPSPKGWRVGVVDGGSSILSFADRSIGFVTALAVVDEGKDYSRRVFPPKLLHQDYGESDGEFSDRVDVERETMVLELAQNLVSELEFLILDGPLIPRPKYVGEYIYQLKTFLRKCEEENLLVVGFVKRPQSRYLSKIEFTDRALLSTYLSRFEACPWPPDKHDPESRVRYTYIKLLDEPEPGVFRIDVPDYLDDGRVLEALSYIAYSSDPIYGPPAILMKADEEVKVSRKLIAELYRTCSYRVMSRIEPKLWGSLSVRWGERVW